MDFGLSLGRSGETSQFLASILDDKVCSRVTVVD